MGASRAKAFLEITTDVNEYLELRIKKYHSIVARNPPQKRFLKGWLARVEKLRKFISNEHS